MGKRFIDTEIFRKKFVKGLSSDYKLLWIYILNDCDFCGVWNEDLEVASLRLGVDFNRENVLKNFGEKIQIIENDKWFIPSFIEFQYGVLNPKNRVHNSVINNLNKYKIKPLTSPLQGVKEKDKDKDKEKDKDKDKDKELDIFPENIYEIINLNETEIHGGLEEFEKNVRAELEKNDNYIWAYQDSISTKEIYLKIHEVAERNGKRISDETMKQNFISLWQKARQDDFHSKNLTLAYFDKHFNKMVKLAAPKKQTSKAEEFIKEYFEQ